PRASLLELPTARFLVVLSPDAFDAGARPIEPDDAGQVARAGQELLKVERCDEGLQFFRQTLALDPRTPAAHKGSGICYAKMKRNREALQAYKQYLLYAPDAPDAARVQEIVSRAEGDITIPERSR
ncbi:MAG: tetratricopeptide repeat protein, partial [Myxococcales bacterium]